MQRKAFLHGALAGLVMLTGCAHPPAHTAQRATPPEPGAFKTVKVNERVYALVGELGQRSPTNLGNNMTAGFIIGDDGVVVIDTSGSRAGAEVMVKAIRAVTDKPIRWAVNTGGQDHRWLGNDHFRTEQGASILASEEGLKDQQARGFQQMEMSRRNIGEAGFAGTKEAYADTTFKARHSLEVKGVQVELIYTGGAHTRGDLWVWLPRERIVFAGDSVFAERLLGIQPGLGFKWIAALERLRDELKPVTVIPGHGNVTTLDKALKDSLSYLLMLRDGSRKLIADGAFDPVEVAEKLDQSAFAYLANYEDKRFRGQNAMRMAEEVFATQK